MTQKLSVKQRNAIAILATGASQLDAATQVRVRRETIGKWLKQPAFAEALQVAQGDAIAQLRNELQEFKAQLITLYQQRIAGGVALLEKAGDRFDDLPDEAIGVRDIPALVMAGDRLIESGCNGWAQMLGVADLIKKLGDDSQ